MPSLARIIVSISEQGSRHGIYLGRRSTKLHVAAYRRSGGAIGGHVPGWPGARILLLEHTGARTGTRRTSPLMYIEDGERVVVTASKAGQPTHPAWFHNLLAHPDATVQIGSEVRRVRARPAGEEERRSLWPRFVAAFPGYDFYRRNATERTIPIVILDPR